MRFMWFSLLLLTGCPVQNASPYVVKSMDTAEGDSEADTEDDVNNWRDIEQADGENASDVVSEADVSATPSSDD